MERKFGALTSSENPDKLAATITGLIVTCASLIVLFAGQLDLPLSMEQVTAQAGVIGTGVGAIWTLFGLLRKIVIAIATR